MTHDLSSRRTVAMPADIDLTAFVDDWQAVGGD
jgi:hypothetical protein